MSWTTFKSIAKRIFKRINKHGVIQLIFGLSIVFILASHFYSDPMLPQISQEQPASQITEEETGENENTRTPNDSSPVQQLTEQELNSTLLTKDYFNVLLLGIDNRPGEDFISNTDTIIVANVNKPAKQIALLSIPRDTQVAFGKETVKINSVARLGGKYQETIRVLEKLLAQKIDGYVISNFDGFKRIVDLVGGITVEVEKDMYFVTGDQQDGVINLKKGLQRLTGSQALQYARFRNDSLADISRTVRQQTVLKALASEMFQLKNIPKLPQMFQQVYRSVDTNFSAADLLGLSAIALNVSGYQVVSQTLPGNFVIEDEISYWKIDDQEIKTVARNLFSEGKTRSMFSKYVQATDGTEQSPGKSQLPQAQSQVQSGPNRQTGESHPSITEHTLAESPRLQNSSPEQTQTEHTQTEHTQEEIIFEVQQL